MPLKLYGRHSLEAYGYRLGEFKGEFCATADWQEWSQEMEDYEQDCNVTHKLWKHFHKYLTASSLEHDVARILQQQEAHGWRFDSRAAWELASTLRRELQETEELLRRQHPYVAGAEFTPKRNNKTQGYIEGATFTRLKENKLYFERSHRMDLANISWLKPTR